LQILDSNEFLPKNPDGPTYPVRLLLFYFDATLIFLDSFHIILFVKELG